MGDELGDLSFEFGRVRESRRCHLDQYNFADPLRVIVQQFLKRTKLEKHDSRSKYDHIIRYNIPFE